MGWDDSQWRAVQVQSSRGWFFGPSPCSCLVMVLARRIAGPGCAGVWGPNIGILRRPADQVMSCNYSESLSNDIYCIVADTVIIRAYPMTIIYTYLQTSPVGASKF